MFEQAKLWLGTLADEAGSVNKLAERFGANEQRMRRALDGTTDPASSTFLGWLESAGAKIVYPDEEETRLRVVKIPMAGTELGAGSSYFYDDEEPEEARHYTFREDFIKKLAAPISALRLFRVRGDSMTPEIYPGDVILVHLRESIALQDGKMYVVRYGGELLIKRIFKLPGGKLKLQSTNENWPSPEIDVDVEDFEVRGVPRWIGRAM